MGSVYLWPTHFVENYQNALHKKSLRSIHGLRRHKRRFLAYQCFITSLNNILTPGFVVPFPLDAQHAFGIFASLVSFENYI